MRSASRSTRSDQYAEVLGWFVEVAHRYGTVIPERLAIHNDVRTIAQQGGLRSLALEAVDNGRVVAAWCAVLDGADLDYCEPDPLPGTFQLKRCGYTIAVYVDGDRQYKNLMLEWPTAADVRREHRGEGVVITLPRRIGTNGTIHSCSDEMIQLSAQEARGLEVHDEVAFTVGRTTEHGRRVAFFVTKTKGPRPGGPGPKAVRRTPRLPNGPTPYGLLPSRSATEVDRAVDRRSTPLFRPWWVVRGLRFFVDELMKCLAWKAAHKITTLLFALLSFLLYKFGVL